MYLVCCQIVAYILKVYYSPSPPHLEVISNGYQWYQLPHTVGLIVIVSQFSITADSLQFVQFTGEKCFSTCNQCYGIQKTKDLLFISSAVMDLCLTDLFECVQPCLLFPLCWFNIHNLYSLAGLQSCKYQTIGSFLQCSWHHLPQNTLKACFVLFFLWT